jgi:anthranilate phosphoribosyltransferase
VLAGRGATALVVRGHDGLDEITPAAATDLWTATGEGIRKTAFDTARFGIGRARPGDLAGGDAAYNAKVVRSVAEGEPGPALDAVLANAAGALAARSSGASAGDFEDAFAAGLDQARAAVGSGAAARLLDQWIALAGELASPR